MWNVDAIQFTRLLSELSSIDLSKDQFDKLASNMEVEPEQLLELLGRATKKWNELKPLLLKKTPFAEDQIILELEENGYINGIVKFDLNEIFNLLDQSGTDKFIERISEKLTNDICRVGEFKQEVLFADGDTLYLQVSSKVDMEEV